MVSAIIIQLFGGAYNYVTAGINSNIEKEDLKEHKEGGIKHGWWGLGFVAFIALGLVIMHFVDGGWNWFMIPALCLERKVVFDISYNHFQKRNLFITHRDEKSIVDNIYNWIFSYNVKLYQIVNIILSIGLQYFIFKA